MRDDRWKLIRYPLVDRTQLFDLAADPYELRNLAGNPAHATKVAEMTALLEKEMARYGDKAPLRVDSPQPAEWTPPPAPPASPRAMRAGCRSRYAWRTASTKARLSDNGTSGLYGPKNCSAAHPGANDPGPECVWLAEKRRSSANKGVSRASP